MFSNNAWVKWAGCCAAIAVSALLLSKKKSSPPHKPQSYSVLLEAPAELTPAPSTHMQVAESPRPVTIPVLNPALTAPNTLTEPTRDGVGEPSAPSTEDTMANIDSSFASQTVDSVWAPSASRRLENGLLVYAVDGSRLQSVECKNTICKVTVLHSDLAHQQSFVEKSFQDSKYWPGARAAIREIGANGEVTTSAFFARDGTELPVLQ